jgi:hypothetical protein
VFEWHKEFSRFSEGKVDVDGKQQNLVIMRTHENVKNVRDFMKTDCHLAIRMTAEKLNMDQPNIQILTQNHERKCWK